MGHMAAASLNQVETTRFGELYEKMDVGDERHKGGGSRTCIYIDYREGARDNWRFKVHACCWHVKCLSPRVFLARDMTWT